MAEAILYGVAQTLIENMGSWAFQEIGSLWNVEDELENIKNTVTTIQAIFQDAAEQQNHNHQVKNWLEKLKDAVYEADDLLSEFYTEALQRGGMNGNITKKVRNLISSSNPLVFRREMHGKINAMRQKLDAIAEDRKKFHLEECNVKPRVSMNREATHSFVPNEKVIGREDDKKAIIKQLLDHNVEENVSVIPILGIGGLGKTTLAQFVYNNDIVKQHFQLKMWVCVSDVFDVNIIVQKIIYATGEAPENHSMDRLQDQLRKKIDQKKYLLVLDDVWNEDFHKWDNLKNLLMGGAKGSRIVITTRIKLVADITSPFSIYTLIGLSENQSWFLFEQIAFRKGQETHNLRLVEIGREIVRKCQGVPLTIKSIGRVLRFKENELEWSYVKDNILESVTQQESGIFPTIKLSYDYLPSNLKGCFAFCSLFPKDYKIDKVILIQLWISQGFIQSSNKQLEDVADAYVKDLLWRSFFEEVSDELGYLKYYKMHDLIHDLAQSIAGAECTLVNLDKNNIDGKTRHISCQFSIDSSFIKTLRLAKANKVRTLLLTHDNYASGAMDMSTLNKLIESFTSLRALDLHGLKITKVPNSIEKLIHLKYVDLSFNYIENLPNSITTLLNLQTLKLQQCLELKQLPGNIAKLVNLRHLDNSGCFGLSYMPHSVGQMTSLQTLPLFIVSKDPHSIFKRVGGLGELNQLNNLRGTLHIICLEQLEDANSECEAANLRGKQHLEKLILRWYQEGNINNADEKSLEELQPHQNLKYLELYGYRGVKFSGWLSSLTNLVDLDLQFCARCKHLPSLSQLPSLKRLYMRYMDDLEYISEGDISDSSTPFFPLLKSLEIHCCYNLKGWWRSTSTLNHQQNQLLPSFPRLSFFKIEHCSNLASMPLFPFLEEELCLIHSSSKPLQQTMAMASLPSSSFTPFPLSKLKSMSLYNIEDDVSLPPNLNSLKCLDIQWCPRLISLSGVMRYLTSLEKLSIKWCDEFNPLSDVDADGMEWRHLNCLRSLNFENLQKLEYLPAGLQNVTTLQSLFISSCPNLKSLPEWISELTSLDKLGIFRCGPDLRSLPHGISCLTSLRWLTISGLPNLTTFPESISNLTSLQELELSHSLLLRSLPDGINCLRSLQKLRIQGFPNLTTFPEISNLTSLEELVISKCPNLTSLPDRISCLRFLP